MVFHILLAKEVLQLKTVIEKTLENKIWEVQIQEVAESEIKFLSIENESYYVAVLQVKDTPNFWNIIEVLRSTYQNLEIILVSQEPDFNLAYQAIQHRISHFLLEPVEKENLIPIFADLEEKQLMLENEKEKEQILLSYELEQHQKLMAKIMTQMMEKPEELAIMMGEVNERYHTKLENTYFCVIQVVILDLLPNSHKEIILNKVQNLCRVRVRFGSETLLSTQYQFELRIVVNLVRVLSNSDLMTLMKPFLQDIKILMDEEEIEEWAVGMGPTVNAVRDVQRSADWAIYALHNWNLNPTLHLFTELNCKGKLEDKNILDQVKRKKIQKYLRQLQLEELEQLMKVEMEKYIIEENPYDVQRMVIEILQLTEEIWSSQLGEKVLEELFSKELFSYIFENEKKIATLIRMLKELEDLVKEQKQSKSNPQISKALEYIHAHYNQALTMEKVALEVDLSPNYFSNLFREETGVNYLDYVTEYRLSQSKTLLKETNWTIEKISKEIGYQDVKYYSQLFKKYYDATPGKYRKAEG